MYTLEKPKNNLIDRPTDKQPMVNGLIESTCVEHLESGMIYIGNGLKVKPNSTQDVAVYVNHKGKLRHQPFNKGDSVNSYVAEHNPATGSYATVDFTPAVEGENFQHNLGNLRQKTVIMKEALVSALKLIEMLEEGEIESDYFHGDTNEDMKKFALKIGFQKLNSIGIIASREDLVANKKKVKALLQVLLKRLERST